MAAIGACAQVSLEIPFSPVPVTLQTFAVLCVGGLLGLRWGTLSVSLYLAAGAAGLPVFADASSGLDALTGPTAGYLVGFVPGAALMGALQRWRRRPTQAILAAHIATALIVLPGVLWLARFIGFEQALSHGLYPFLPGAVFKATAAGLLLWGVRR